MSSSEPDRARTTILYNIALARRFVAGMTFEEFAADERAVYAVTRCLEIVSEASRRLPQRDKDRYPEVPWVQVAGAGNVYRHDYEDVLASILWNTVHYRLDALETAVTAMGPRH
jgi:uncharacterized protein with HEPN domain